MDDLFLYMCLKIILNNGILSSSYWNSAVHSVEEVKVGRGR